MIRIEKIKKIYNQGKSNEFEALKDITCNIHNGFGKKLGTLKCFI